MQYLLTLKGLALSKKAELIVSRQRKILSKKLTNFTEYTPQLTIIIKKHEKNHFYSGTMTLLLPKKKLHVKLTGHEITDLLHAGFDTLNTLFEEYKARHFKGSSKYPFHNTLEDKKLDI